MAGGLLGADGRRTTRTVNCPAHVMVPIQFAEREELLTGKVTYDASIIFCFNCGTPGFIDGDLIQQIKDSRVEDEE